MARNLVLCCDGTSNRFTSDRTNVLKLCYALVKDADRQLVYYHPGIGTRAPVGIGTAIGGFWGKLGGLAFGAGLQDDIADAYVFLMNHYRPGDRVYLFGFSRGAYTARVIAGMLKLYGLSMPGNDALVPYAVEMMWAISKTARRGAGEGVLRAGRGIHQDALGGPVQAALPRRVGHGQFGRLDRQPARAALYPQQSRHRDHPPRDRHRREARVLPRELVRTRSLASISSRCGFPARTATSAAAIPRPRAGFRSTRSNGWRARRRRPACCSIPNASTKCSGGAAAGSSRRVPGRRTIRPRGFWHIAEFVPKARYNRATGRTEQRMNRYRRRTMPDDACVHDVAWDDPRLRGPPSGRAPSALSEKRWDFEDGSTAPPT